MRQNPWASRSTPNDQGKAVVTVGMRFPVRGGRAVVFTKRHIEKLVRRATEGASVVFQVGVTKLYGREPSAQVVMFNASSWTQPWRPFNDAAKRVAAELAHALGQEETLLETQRASGAYRIDSYRNETYPRERRQLARAAKAQPRRAAR